MRNRSSVMSWTFMLTEAVLLPAFFVTALVFAAADPIHGDEAATRILTGHSGMVQSLTVDESGGRMVSGGVDKASIAWDLLKGSELHKFTEPNQPVVAVAVTPDGKKALTARRDKTVYLWDTATGKTLGELPKHKDVCTALVFNGEGTQFVTGTAGGELWLWNTDNVEKPVLPFKGHTKSIGAIAFSENGLMLVSGAADKVLAVWDVTTGKNRAAIEDAHNGPILAVALDSSGMHAFSGSADKTATLWDVIEQKRLGRITGHKDAVVMVAFHPTDESLWTASKDRTLVQWDRKGKELETYRADAPIVCARMSGDGSTMVLGLQNGSAVIRKRKGAERKEIAGGLEGRRPATSESTAANNGDAPAGKAGDRLVFRFQGHGDQVTSVAYGSNDRNFASSSKEGRAILWDFDGENAKSTALSVGKDAYGAAVLADNRSVIVAAEDLSVFFWNAASKAPAKMLNAHSAPLMCVAAMKSGSGWASGGRDFNIYLWNGGGSDAVGKLTGHKEAVMGIAFNRDGSRLASASADKMVGIWDTRSKKAVHVLKGHANVVRCVAFSPDGKLLASGSFDNTAKIWDVGTGKLVKSFTAGDKGVFGVAFSADGEQLFTGGGDRNIIIWDVESGDKLETLTGQPGAVTGLSVSPDGTRLLSSGGTEVLLWDISK